MAELLDRLKKNWATPQPVMHPRAKAPIFLHCVVEEPPALGLDEDGSLFADVPEPLLQMWRHARSARLFVDVQYGQWGLEIGSHDEVRGWTDELRRRRARDFREGDLVVGKFLGDSDQLVLRADPGAEDYGRVLVALPLDRRDDWYDVAPDLETFLVDLERADGGKYREP
jgi:hypothetical protein